MYLSNRQWEFVYKLFGKKFEEAPMLESELTINARGTVKKIPQIHYTEHLSEPLLDKPISPEASCPIDEAGVVFDDKKISHYSFEESADMLRERQKFFFEGAVEQEDAVVEMKTTYPTLIRPTGDWHMFNVMCDINRLQHDLKEIEERPNAFLILMSNLIDSPNPAHYDSVVVNTLSPEEQMQTMAELIKRLDAKHKILAAIDSPCHDGVSWRKLGIDAFATMFRDVSFPIMRNGSILTLRFPDYETKWALYHQFGPFNSNYNKSHGMQQMQRLLLRGQADVVCGAHHHVGESLKTWFGEGRLRKPVIYVRTGSYKGAFDPDKRDIWYQGRAGKSGEPGGQSVIVYPHEKQMSTELEADLAMRMHKGMVLLQRVEEGK